MNKKNINSLLEKKMKAIRVKADKSFKNNLLNSLEKEYESGFVKDSKQNFNFINLDIMKNIMKKVSVGLVAIISILGVLGIFNTSYADSKDSVFDYISAGFELIVWDMKEGEIRHITTEDGDDFTVEMVSEQDGKLFDSMSKEDQIRELQKQGKLPADINVEDVQIMDGSFDAK